MISKNKLNEVFEFIEKKNLDAILLTNFYFCKDPNFIYFSNFCGEGYLLISKNFFVLFVNPLEIKNVKKFKGEILEAEKKRLGEFLKKNKIKKIGINSQRIFFNFVKFLDKKLKIKVFDVNEFLSKLRSIKTKEEIRLIKNACRIANSIIKKIEKRVEIGISEKYLQNLIICEIRKKAEIAFEPIVAFDRRSAIPHPIPKATSKRINKIGYVDFGVCFKNYNCDVTFLLLKEENRIAEIILQSFEKIEEMLRIGNKASEITIKAEKFFEREGLKLMHSLGHGIGLEVHELPIISKKSKDVLKKNMVVAIEPATYLKNFGIRIENDYLIRGKPKKLTFSKIIWL